MQQQTGHYANYSGPPSDPYNNPSVPSYGSAPPYAGSAYYAGAPESTSSYQNQSYQSQGEHQNPPQPYQNQAYAPPAPGYSQSPASGYGQSPSSGYSQSPASLVHAIGGLSISSVPSVSVSSSAAGAPPPPPLHNSYAPTVPSYEQSYATPSMPPQQVVQAPPPPQSPTYTASGNQAVLYDQSSYSTPHQVYDPSVSYGSNLHAMAPPQSPQPIKTDYDSNQIPVQGYDYNSYGVPQGQMSNYDQGGGSIYSPAAVRDYDRPVYSQGPGYDTGSYKSNGLDRGQSKNSYDYDDLGLGDVYAYDGGHSEPYGARGTGSSSWGGRDSYNSSSVGGGYSSFRDSGASKLPKAVPKVDNEDKNSGVQKYRVKILSDYGSGSGPQDVLCQIGLDGVRMVSPSTNKTVRIYPLETITRWEVSEPSIFTFWAKSAVDIEPRRIRLQSGSYTTNSILDTLTAAVVQFSEMVDKNGGVDSSKEAEKVSDQSSDKKKPTLVGWMSLRNRVPAPEEKQHWVPDEAVSKCTACGSEFGAFLRRHHCRNCGDVFCDKCTNGRTPLTAEEDAPVVRVCDRCLAEVTHRLTNAKELSSRPPPALRSHEDLAKKLQEEMERNSKKSSTTNSSSNSRDRSGQTSVFNCTVCGSISLVSGNARCPACGVDSSGSRSGRSGSDGKRMREVACPTCTVHLQVQVPSSGTETVECGVCQHPFLVSAH